MCNLQAIPTIYGGLLMQCPIHMPLPHTAGLSALNQRAQAMVVSRGNRRGKSSPSRLGNKVLVAFS